MSRIGIPTRDEAPADSRAVLDAADKLLGFVPNLHRLMSLSPSVLNGWWGLMGQLSKTLDARTRDGIALTVSEANGCNYCLAAHTFVATTFAKLSQEEIANNRQGHSSDQKRDAAIRFAKEVIATRGKVADADLATVRDAGFSDAQILEIVALSVQFLLTNFMNNLADTEIDFPIVAGH
jgi:uncharacterized peroxidase-related enzyme